MNEADACKLACEGSPDLHNHFGEALKQRWLARAKERGGLTPFALAFGTCHLKLARFYEAGDFAAAYTEATANACE